MGVGSGLYMYDVVVKRSRSLSHLLMSSCHHLLFPYILDNMPSKRASRQREHFTKLLVGLRKHLMLENTPRAFFDIEGAFTSCKSTRLALDEWKIHRPIRNWVITMLAHQTILAKAVTLIILAIASCGLPQGGGLSPILWSLVADSLLKWLSKQGAFAQGFADGVVLICGSILSTICDIMQRILYGIKQWSIDRELSVNPSKTEMVLFTRQYKREKLKTI